MTGASQRELPSVLAPASVEAEALHEVTLVLFVGAAIVFVGTMALLAWSLRRTPRRPVSPTWWIVGGGIALPVAVLSALLLYSTQRTAGLERTLTHPPLAISVTGRLWWWEVRYRDPATGREIVSANELRVPMGQSTQIALTSADVIHSLWVPELGGKRDLVPGRVNHLVITPKQPGTYRGQCAEYCGTQHAKMALHVVALPPAEFERWLAHQARPASGTDRSSAGMSTNTAASQNAASAAATNDATSHRVESPAAANAALHGAESPAATNSEASQNAASPAAPSSDVDETLVARGRRAFAEHGCASCHTVRGDAGASDRGPDLTHVAGRLSLGAGVLANGPGAAKRWLVGVQQLKPGARMPSYAHLDAATLDALAAYLEQLR
jgi:cytochrome c oxidase subunit 2